MKFNLWRIIAIVVVSFLMIVIWYLMGLNETTAKNNMRLKEEKNVLERKIGDLSNQKKEIEEALSVANSERIALLGKVGEYENSIKSLTAETERVKKELAGANESIAKKEVEIGDLKKRSEKYEAGITALKKKLAHVALNSVKKVAPNSGTGKDGGLKDKDVVNLSPITITVEGKTRDARVLEVNKKYGFVVIDIGSNSGLKPEDTLFIFRNKNLIGRVVVEKVGDEASIARLSYKSLIENVQRGDRISY